MKALVVGLGSIGRRHARNWVALGLGEVWVARQTGAPLPEPLAVDARFFASLAEALAAGPDVVFVCTPTSLHVATARAAVMAGCHVFVEKPLGADLEGVADLLRAADAAGRTIWVGYNLRFHPGLARTRALLHGGAIGRPVALRAEVGEYLPDWHPWEDYRQSYSARADLGGGPILTFSHELDSVCWLLGAPERVTAVASHASSLEVTTEDVAEIVLQFPGGLLGSVHVDYVRRPPRRFVEIVGEAGVLRWEYEENRVLVYAPGTREWRVEQGDPRYTRNDMFLDEARHVATGVSGSAQPLVDGWQGAAILAIADAARRSSRLGRTIDLRRELPGDVSAWLNSLAPPSPSLLSPTFSA